jgi:hypothetical protein
VGPSGQWHCRPAPRPGWPPWAALSGCAPHGYLDVVSRVQSRAATVSHVRSRPSPRLARHPDSPGPMPHPPRRRSDCHGSEATCYRCSGKPLRRRVFTPSRPLLTALLLLRRSPRRRESPSSHAAERRITGRLTAAPLLLRPGELAALPVLLRSRRHAECVDSPPASMKSPPLSTRAPPLWAARLHSSGPCPAWPVGHEHHCASRPRAGPWWIQPSGI